MWAGHLGAALALERADRSVNLGWLFLGVQLLDVILWVLVLGGVEHVTIPPDYATRHYFLFDFPYSHSLPASVAWTLATWVMTVALAGRGANRRRRWRAATVMAAAVLSHFVLDVIVHPAQPLPDGNTTIGMGLWDAMPLAIAIELAITAGGLWLWRRGQRAAGAATRGVSVLVAVVAAMTVVGMTVAPAPTSVTPVAVTSLVSALAVSAIAAWLDRASRTA
jgi:hypothetical protein